MNFPTDLKYTKEHEWVRVNGNIATVGITDFAQSELGEIVFIDIPTLGETIGVNEIVGSIEAVKTVSDIFMPVTGKVAEINNVLIDSPEVVNEDVYQKGWILKIEMESSAQIDQLLSAEEYKSFIGK